MKIVALIGFFIIFTLGLFTVSLAQESAPDLVDPSPTPVEYTLPYPGILPGHPLFFVKNVRDQLLLRLISNPRRKVEFYILMADKRLNMAIFLMNDGRNDTALRMGTDAVNYLTVAEKNIFEIPIHEDIEVNDLKERLEDSMQKHRDIFEGYSQGEYENASKWLELKQQIDALLLDFTKKD